MAVNCVMKAEGITGNSEIETGSIQLFSFSFGGSNPSSLGTSAGDSRSGKPDLSDLNVMKAMDATSPFFFEKMCKCEPIPKVNLKYFKNIKDQNTLYIEYELTNVYVASQQWSGSSENPTESLSLAFDEVAYSYYKENDTNDGVVLSATKKYNMRTNKSA